jgi:hypothetical protein
LPILSETNSGGTKSVGVAGSECSSRRESAVSQSISRTNAGNSKKADQERDKDSDAEELTLQI